MLRPDGRAGRGREQNSEDQAPWHFLYFLPLPHGQGSLRPAFFAETACFFSAAVPLPPTNCSSAISLSFLRWILRVKSSTTVWAARRCSPLAPTSASSLSSSSSSSSSSGEKGKTGLGRTPGPPEPSPSPPPGPP